MYDRAILIEAFAILYGADLADRATAIHRALSKGLRKTSGKPKPRRRRPSAVIAAEKAWIAEMRRLDREERHLPELEKNRRAAERLAAAGMTVPGLCG